MAILDTALEAVRAITDPEDQRQFRVEWLKIRSDWEQAPAVEQGKAEVVADLREQGTIQAPETVTEEALPETPDTIPAWVNPGTLHEDMYLYGDIVQHNGRVVRSTHRGLNHWEPGTLAFDGRIWEDITDQAYPPVVEEPEVPEEPTDPETGEPVEPTPEPGTEPEAPATPQWAAGVNYKIGDQVLYNGATYEVIQAHTSAAHWPPNAVASLYTKVA